MSYRRIRWDDHRRMIGYPNNTLFLSGHHSLFITPSMTTATDDKPLLLCRHNFDSMSTKMMLNYSGSVFRDSERRAGPLGDGVRVFPVF
jgi:hypothetical protein